MDDIRLNNRDVKIIIKHFLNGMPNQQRVYGLSFLLKANGEFKGKELLPLNWFDPNDHRTLLPKYQELIENETQNFTRIYKYIANTSEERVGVLELKKDSDLIEAVMLLSNPAVKADFVSKQTNNPLLFLEREDIKRQKELDVFDKKFEVQKEIYANKDAEHVLDKYIVIMGYNPSNFENKAEKIVWLLRQSEIDLDKIYQAITMRLEEQIASAFFNLAMQAGLISNITGQGYKYGEVYMGHTREEAMAWLQKPSNESVKKAIIAQLPEKRRLIIRDAYLNEIEFPKTKETVDPEISKTGKKKKIEDIEKTVL
jgi:hypothetical protein